MYNALFCVVLFLEIKFKHGVFLVELSSLLFYSATETQWFYFFSNENIYILKTNVV